MGQFKFVLRDIFKKRLLLNQYDDLDSEAREVVDYTLKTSLKANSVLRIRSLFKTKYLHPKHSDLWNLSWSDRIEIGMILNENDLFEALKLVYGINQKQFKKLELFNAFAVYQWITESIAEIITAEMEELHYEPNESEKNAGIEEFDRYGYYNSLDQLTNGNLLVQDDWLKLPYKKIFRKQCRNRTQYEYNNNLRENATRTNSGND